MEIVSTTEFLFRPLTRAELDTALLWAAREGWNPGHHDAEAFWEADPEGFWGVYDAAGELVGSISVVSYETFGFVGLFIVRPEHRGRGFGTGLWQVALDALRQRLAPGAPLSLDGVFAMQDSYAKSGFVFTHRNLRMEGIGEPAAPDSGLVDLSSVDPAIVCAHDLAHFGADRSAFLRKWLATPGCLGVGLLSDDRLVGSGLVRPCGRGYKIGPLFADEPAIAERIFTALSDHAAGHPLFLDTPENNPAALALAARHGMTECFGCARMVSGSPPAIPWDRIYGVTSFELG